MCCALQTRKVVFIMKSVELDIFTSADPQNLRASLVTTLGCTDRAGLELVLR